MKRTVSFTLFILCVFVNLLYGQQPSDVNGSDSGKVVTRPKRVYVTQRITGEHPKIDGKLNDACWQQGNWSGDYRQYMPKGGAPPSQQTVLKVLYDNDNMYVAIRAYDTEPEKIDRRTGRRDHFDGDMVGINFDSYHDLRTGFEFNLTAAGVKIDLMLLNDGWDTSWDAVWYGETALEDSAWTAEMRIPLSQLRYANAEELVWGMHSWRWINRFQEENQWNLFPRDAAGLVMSFGELHGIKGLTKSRRIELLPYSIAKLTNQSVGGSADNQFDWNVGFDGKFGLSSDFTMDVTVNPDFGQIEADPSVLNLTVFETFYEEKRPFFLEAKNIFSYAIDDDLMFYSRRIGHAPSKSASPLESGEQVEMPEFTNILSAIKISGKTKNGFSLGIIETVTANEHARYTSETGDRTELVEPLTNYTVCRMQKDFDKGNTIIGGILTSTLRPSNNELDYILPDMALTSGLDFKQFFKDKEYYLDTRFMFSNIQGTKQAIADLQTSSTHYFQRPGTKHLTFDPEATSLTGSGGSIAFGKGSKGKWRFSERLKWFSPALELNELGFLPAADQISSLTNVKYEQFEPVSIFRTYKFAVGLDNTWDFGGNYQQTELEMDAECAFNNKWGISSGYHQHFNTFDNRLLRGGPTVIVPSSYFSYLSINTDQSKKVSFNGSLNASNNANSTINYYGFSAGLNYQVMNMLGLIVSLDYSVETDDIQYVETVQLMDATDYLLGQLDRRTLGITFRLDCNITPELTIQYYGSPYVSNGIYSDFKTVIAPEADSYDNRFAGFTGEELVFLPQSNSYRVDRAGTLRDFAFDNPDFNFSEFRSNLVLRWEYKPGSTLFFVWTQNRFDYSFMTGKALAPNLDSMFDITPKNVFMIKFSYWFSM